MDSTIGKNGFTREDRDSCRHFYRDFTNKEYHLLVASLWHGLFFPSIKSTTLQSSLNTCQRSLPGKVQINEKDGAQIDSKGVLRLLEAAGYYGARNVLLQLEKVLTSDFDNLKNPSSALVTNIKSSVEENNDIDGKKEVNVDIDEAHKFTSSLQQCFCMCAAEYIILNSGPLLVSSLEKENDPPTNFTPLQTVLQMALDRHLRYQQQCQSLSPEYTDELSKWFSEIAHVIIGKEEGNLGVNKAINPIGTIPRLFKLSAIKEDGASSMKTHASDVGVTFQGQQCLPHIFHISMLYGALCISSSYTAVRPLAVLLTAYIYQDCSSMKQLLSSTTHHTDLTTTLCTGDVDNDFSSLLALTRLRGVISGILEYTLRFQDADPIAVRHALDRLMGEKKNDSGDATLLEGIASEPGKSSGLLQSAVILFMQLIQETVEWTTARRALGTHSVPEHGLDEKTSPLATGDAEPVMAAKEIVHAIQELLFTVVLGAGTRHMPKRPSVSTAVKPPQANKSTHTTRGKPKPFPAIADHWMVTTRRALTLGEADALSEELFPAVLQQLGWEWPWSELLRQCRMLDKQQQAPLFPLVAWGSHQLFDTVFMQVAQRTYPKRLQNVLPRSFDRTLEALHVLAAAPASTSNGDVNAKEGTAGEGLRSPQLFPMPSYYAGAGDAVVSYLQLSGISGVRAAEVERVLSQTTSTLPIIVQLRALAPPTTSRKDRGGCEDSNQQADNEESAMQDGQGERYLLTAERVVELEARYCAEVLLASLVVYTQLSLPSQVQNLMRIFAPLFDKLSSLCSRSYSSFTSYLIVPSTTNNTLFHTNENNNADSASVFGLTFAKEAEHLINAIGYQFYPLEWMPAVAAAYYNSMSTTSSERNNNSSNTNQCITSSALPYSMFAAVAHQFGTNFNIALGSSGMPSQRHPAGASSTLVVPSFMTSKSTGAVYFDNNIRSNISDHNVNRIVHWKRAELFLQVLLLDCFLFSRSSSCELEGTMAVAATRRVHTSTGSTVSGHESPLLRATGNLQPGLLEAFWTQKAISYPLLGKAEVKSEDVVPSNSNRTNDNSSLKRTRQERSQVPFPARRNSEAIKTLVDVLSNYGAASFSTTIESKDIILVLMQSFLPCTTLVKNGGDKDTILKVHSKTTSSQLLRQASAWAQEMISSQADHSRMQVLLRQKLQSSQTSFPVSSHQIHSIYHTVFNSCTWDSCSLARRIFRKIPSRMLEKTKLRCSIMDQLTKWRDVCLQANPDSNATSDLKTPSQIKERESECINADVDPLLRYQWLQWKSILDKLNWKTRGTGAEFIQDSSIHHAEVPALSTAQWLWYSPYFTQSL
ncbi:unnamed protein product [Phytomonas sp. Hart1]|nr:unnamed protein product [Phytomonas sp. Hart1]|eukprot:CCW67608.1 unnamed protein product [Phytomonas sp. isolate Hart1]